jgi:hypothetical protein
MDDSTELTPPTVALSPAAHRSEHSGLHDLRGLLASSATRSGAPAGSARDSLLDIVTAREALVPLTIPPVPSRLPRLPRVLRDGSAVSVGRVARASLAVAVLALSAVALAAVPAPRPGSLQGALEPGLAVLPADPAPAPPTTPELPSPGDVSTAKLSEPDLGAPLVIPPPDATGVAPRPAPTRRAAAPPRAPVAAPDAPRHLPAVAPERPPAPAGSIDPGLAGLIDAALARPRAPAGSAASLPSVPSQTEVRASLRALEREVAMCRDSSTAPGTTVQVRLVLEGATGRVAQADASGSGVSDAVAACVERRVQTVELGRFERERLTVTYPYRL